ncbi:MAG: pilus assembly protein TadG-related protein [Anaerolineales bacterium]
MKIYLQNYARGQAIIMFVLAIFGLLAMSALVVDGGQAYLSRRQAQAAADAGALAGARDLCKGSKQSTIAITIAQNYAISENHATSATAWIQDGEVHVQATVSYTSFFAQLLGIPCFTPAGGDHILPVSWACHPPLFGSDSPDCEMRFLDWNTQLQPMITGSPGTVNIGGTTISTPFNFKKNYLPSHIYVIMDSNKTAAEFCLPYPGGTVDCDLNNDGVNDIGLDGDRSWLDLSGAGGGASDLKRWIRYGYDNPIYVHTWIPEQSGVDTSVYNAVNDYQVGKVVLVPVFNAICQGDPLKPSNQNCLTTAHTSMPLGPGDVDTVVYTSGASTKYFHIVGFANFYITCVDAGSNSKCPGHDAAVAAKIVEKNRKSIEGYFVSGYPVQGLAGTGGVDVGVYIISLTK